MCEALAVSTAEEICHYGVVICPSICYCQGMEEGGTDRDVVGRLHCTGAKTSMQYFEKIVTSKRMRLNWHSGVWFVVWGRQTSIYHHHQLIWHRAGQGWPCQAVPTLWQTASRWTRHAGQGGWLRTSPRRGWVLCCEFVFCSMSTLCRVSDR